YSRSSSPHLLHLPASYSLSFPTRRSSDLNLFYVEGKGIFACISPWNFPLAIYLGQIVAALVSGNVVLAKPAEQTCLLAYRAIQLDRKSTRLNSSHVSRSYAVCFL